MREKVVEQKLINAVKARGGICPKWVSPSFAGVPDRLVFLPEGKFGMVEVKRAKGKPRALQVSRHKLLNKLGFTVYVLDSLEQIGGILDAIEST
ncbi:VRR-NUC domain-containing protein [Streptococcus anginosus]|uniref:VRR-NUC domain-containing protein n=1 Tax=Streptococcus anginosus TaxID=1328 RepID=UPI0022E132E5|nr:VRR-NUC domain-containing protein [Streptococcus anginosus]